MIRRLHILKLRHTERSKRKPEVTKTPHTHTITWKLSIGIKQTTAKMNTNDNIDQGIEVEAPPVVYEDGDRTFEDLAEARWLHEYDTDSDEERPLRERRQRMSRVT